MASFKQVQTEFIETKYEGGIKVFLESAEDVRIFSDHWFSHKLDKLRFVSAEEGKSGGGGCQVVISKVEKSNEQDIKAYGIVDRDVLLAGNKTEIFWESDDTKFHDAQPYGEKIHVLRRWELENYLLQPSAFAEEVSRRISRSPVPSVSADTLLEYAEDIIQVTALTALSVSKSITSPSPGFGIQSSGLSLSEEINKHLEKNFPDEVGLDVSNEINKIKTFEQNAESTEEKWNNLTRILDGKKSLMRLCHHLSDRFDIKSFKIWEEMRGCLANSIASNETIDSELIELIENIEKLR
ncbi:MAG: DUF4435 domain-containing protein [Methylococcaceae bacterium]|nr:DUF4435 domain-containing protein [Methylococcaceae bacterium]